MQVEPGLAEALLTALDSDPSIAAAKSDLRASGADLSAARWLRFPSVTLEGRMLNQRGNPRQVQVVVDEPVWNAGRLSSTIRGATSRQAATIAALDQTTQAVALAVVESYYNLYRFRAQVRLLAESAVEHKQMLDAMQRRVKQEVSPLSDLNLARTRAIQIDQQLTVARANASVTLQRLRSLVGNPGYDPLVQFDEPAAWPQLSEADMEQQALAFDPKLKRLRAEAKASDAQADAAAAARLPQLSGQYSYDYVYGHRIGLVLRIQSEGGLAGFAEADAARARAQSGAYRTAAAERDLSDTVASAVLAYQANVSRLAGGTTSAELSRSVMQSYFRQFSAGRRTWLDLMNAVRESTEASIDALNARSDARMYWARLMLLTGQWQTGSDGK